MAIKPVVLLGADSQSDLADIDTLIAAGAYQSNVPLVVMLDTGRIRVKNGTWGEAADLSKCWPVGSIFASTVNINPATSLGFGTWAAFGAGKVLIGLDAGDPDFDTAEETGGAKTVAAAGSVAAPTFTGSSASTSSNSAGTPAGTNTGAAVSSHSGAAVADHAAHTHSVTSNVAVADHASHTHTSASSTATPKLVTSNTSTGVSLVTGGPSATLSHSVTNNAVTSGNPGAALTHSVTQPADHTVTQPTFTGNALAGHSHTVTATGTNSAPTFTGSPTSVVQPYVVVRMWL